MGEMTANEIIDQAKFRSPVKSQATAIEQSRVTMEVLGALQVAKAMPRDEQAAERRMLEECQSRELAEAAFYSVPRAGGAVKGPSVHLATALARCWGNLNYGIVELDRDEQLHRSEMLAFAWDLETNTHVEKKVIVNHTRDKKSGPERLTDSKDIRDNNSNVGARGLRDCIFRIVPARFLEQAQKHCQATLERGDGSSIEDRRKAMLAAFERLGVSRSQIERRMKVSIEKMDEVQVANMQVIFRSIQKKEIRVSDEFEPDQGREIKQGLTDQASAPDTGKKQTARKTKAAEPKPDPAPEESENPAPAETAPTRWETFGTDGEPAEFETPDLAAADLIGLIKKVRTTDDLEALQNRNTGLLTRFRETGCNRHVADVMNSFKARAAELKAG